MTSWSSNLTHRFTRFESAAKLAKNDLSVQPAKNSYVTIA